MVSDNGFADATFGAAVEVGIPVHSSVSKNTGVIPKIFNDLRLGDHFTLQSIVAYSTLFSGGPDGGLQTLEYGLVFGYTIQREELRVPGVQQSYRSSNWQEKRIFIKAALARPVSWETSAFAPI